MVNESPRILVVENENKLHEILKNILDSDFSLFCLRVEEYSRRFIKDLAPDLMVLAHEIPVTHVEEICQDIRHKCSKGNIPIIIFSWEDQKVSVQDKIKFFNFGVDDFVSAPWDSAELKAFFKARVRNAIQSQSGLLRLGNLEIKFEDRRVRLSNKLIELSSLEFKLICFFVRNEKKVLNRDEILRNVWGDDVQVSPRTIDAHVVNLRRKLRDFSHELTSFYGFGYGIRERNTQSAPETV